MCIPSVPSSGAVHSETAVSYSLNYSPNLRGEKISKAAAAVMRELFFLPVFLGFGPWQRIKGEVTVITGAHKELRNLDTLRIFLPYSEVEFTLKRHTEKYFTLSPIPLSLL